MGFNSLLTTIRQRKHEPHERQGLCVASFAAFRVVRLSDSVGLHAMSLMFFGFAHDNCLFLTASLTCMTWSFSFGTHEGLSYSQRLLCTVGEGAEKLSYGFCQTGCLVIKGPLSTNG